MTAALQPTFDEIAVQVLSSEDTPTYEVLEHWIERYPRYAQELGEFFGVWASQLALELTVQQDVELDVERFVQRSADRALARFDGEDRSGHDSRPSRPQNQAAR